MSIIDKILKEGLQRGVLYHYTTAQALRNILEQNVILPNKLPSSFLSSGKDLNVVSTTRDKNFHKVNRKDYGLTGDEVRVELDGDKLSHNYKIVPYNFFHNDEFTDKSERLPARPNDSESEEIIIVNEKGIVNARKYITAVTFITSQDKETVEVLNKYNIPFK